MSTRRPFEGLPPGCPPLDFDVDIVPAGFLFCTVPPVTEAPLAPMTFEMDPDIPMGPYCPCIPTAHGSGLPTIWLGQTRKPVFQLTMWNATGDCCEPELTMKIDIGVPCMPLEISGTAGVGTIKLDDKELSFKAELTRRPDTCALTYAFTLGIPCMPLEISGTGGAPTIRLDGNPQISFRPVLTRRPDSCALTYAFTLAIPCLPLYVTGSTPHPTIRMDDPRISFRAQFTRRPETCALTYNFTLAIPCMPLDITGSKPQPTILLNTKKVDFSVLITKRIDTCVLTHRFTLAIPCMPLAISGIRTLRITGDVPLLTAEIKRRPDTCALTYSFDVRVPCLPAQVTSEFTGTVNFVLRRPMVLDRAHILRRTQIPTCKIGFRMNLNVPCLPFSITAFNPQVIVGPVGGPPVLKFNKVEPCDFNLDFQLKLACMPFSVKIPNVCPEFVFPGEETVCLSVFTGQCQLEFQVHLRKNGYRGCVKVLSDLRLENARFMRYYKEFCYTNGRLYTVKTTAPEELVKLMVC